MDDIYFLDFLMCQVTAGCWYRLVFFFSSPFFTSCGQRLKNHSGISWNGNRIWSVKCFELAADTKVWDAEWGREVRGCACLGKGGGRWDERWEHKASFCPKLWLRFTFMQYHILKNVNHCLLLSFEHLACGTLGCFWEPIC